MAAQALTGRPALVNVERDHSELNVPSPQSSPNDVDATIRVASGMALLNRCTSAKPNFFLTSPFGFIETPRASSRYESKYCCCGIRATFSASRYAFSAASVNGYGMPGQNGLNKPSE